MSVCSNFSIITWKKSQQDQNCPTSDNGHWTPPCIQRQSNSVVRPAVDGPGQQCWAPPPCFLQEHRNQAGQRSPSVNIVSHPLFHSHQLSSVLPLQHWHGLVCGSSTPPVRLAASRLLPISFSPFCLRPSPFFLCLSTHLSSQRILHWSNECANSACCIKCGHPNKLHPLQGIGVTGSEAALESVVTASSSLQL